MKGKDTEDEIAKPAPTGEMNKKKTKGNKYTVGREIWRQVSPCRTEVIDEWCINIAAVHEETKKG